MSARKKVLTANPVLDGMVDVPPAPPLPRAARGTVRLIVRVKAGGPERRHRAGLGPFGAQPVEVAASAEQRAQLEADGWLEVEALP